MARQKIENRETIPRYIRGRVLDDCRGICAHCGNKLDFYEDFTLEHVIPLSKGGSNAYENFVALCKDCNEAKADDIIQPIEYYPYLEPKKQAGLRQLFQDYIRSVDWLSSDNLFMLDWFCIHPNKIILLPRSWKPCFIPMELKVEKMRKEEAFTYLQHFKQSLSQADQSLIVKNKQAIDTHYYKVLQQDRILMAFTAFIIPDAQNEDCVWNHILHLDIFINPDVSCNLNTTVPTFYNILQEILERIQETLMAGSRGTAIPVRIRSPKSGHMMKYLEQFIHCIGRGSYNFYEQSLADADKNARISIIYFIMFQGDRHELKTLMKQYNACTFAKLEAKLDRQKLQAPISKRLTDTKKEDDA